MKVILVANVYISYLLSSKEGQTIWRVVRLCLLEREQIQLVVPPELTAELIRNVREKHYLRDRIPLSEMERFVSHLCQIAETPPALQEEIPSFVSDSHDDYLIVHGLDLGVEYLVTGDRRLRSLGQVDTLRIVTPSEFLDILIGQEMA